MRERFSGENTGLPLQAFEAAEFAKRSRSIAWYAFQAWAALALIGAGAFVLIVAARVIGNG